KIFYKGLKQESNHEDVISLEERKRLNSEHGEVYLQGDLSSEEQQDINLSKSDGLFIINEDNKKCGAIVPLQLIVQYLASNQEVIAKEKGLSIIQLENIIDRLELTLKSEGL